MPGDKMTTEERALLVQQWQQTAPTEIRRSGRIFKYTGAMYGTPVDDFVRFDYEGRTRRRGALSGDKVVFEVRYDRAADLYTVRESRWDGRKCERTEGAELENVFADALPVIAMGVGA